MQTCHHTIASIKAANAAAGHHFFERGTMRFFSSRVASKRVYDCRRFITSEQFCDRGACEPRRYTIREIDDNGHISTVGEFQDYATLAETKRAITALPATPAS